MILEKLSQHLLDAHDIAFFGRDYDDNDEGWIFQSVEWKRMGSPTCVTSESENEVSEHTYQDEEEEPTLVPQLAPTIAKISNSDSSSDSSSGNISQGQSKKKSI